jgi:hypothetical protein
MSLEVGSHDNGEDAEHGVPAVPALGVGGDTEAAAGELGVGLSELLNSLGHGVSHAQGADACEHMCRSDSLSGSLHPNLA